MEGSNMRPAWMEDELVRDIPSEKLDFLNRLFVEANGTRQTANNSQNNKQNLMLKLMPLLRQAKTSHLAFTPQEMQAAIAAIQKHSTPEELQQIDQLLKKNAGTGNPPPS